MSADNTGHNQHRMDKTIKLTRLTAEEAAILLSRSGKRAISGQDVAAIAQKAGLLSADGTLNLVQLAAYLAQESVYRFTVFLVLARTKNQNFSAVTDLEAYQDTGVFLIHSGFERKPGNVEYQ